ncbi:unnamed protein product, partial [Closterium sp. NIES-54]
WFTNDSKLHPITPVPLPPHYTHTHLFSLPLSPPSFTKWFTNDIKLHRGTVIDITRRPGHVLETKIDGKYMGSTKSALISRALFELYVGDKPFDKKAREGLVEKLISVVHS